MIVREYTAPNGVVVRIHDDAYAGISREEMARRREQIRQAIVHIYDQVREIKKKEMEGEKDEADDYGDPGGD